MLRLRREEALLMVRVAKMDPKVNKSPVFYYVSL